MADYTIKVNNDCKIKIKVNAFKCLRCNHEWIPRVELEELKNGIKKLPRICPSCKSAYWYDYKKNGTNQENKK